MKKTVALILCAVLLCTLLAGCHSKKDPTSSETTTKKEQQVDPNDVRGNAVSSLPVGLDFGDAEINIAIRDRDDIAFEMDAEANSIDKLSKDIAERNLAVEDELGVTLQLKRVPGTWAERETFMTMVRTNAQAGSQDVYDIVMGPNYSLTPLMGENLLVNLLDLEYLDVDQPWWNENFIDECIFNNRLYMLEGELTMSMIDSAFVVFADTLNYTNLAPNEDLYEVVQDHEWTLEKLEEYVKDFWLDDGDSVANSADTFGMVSPTFSCGRDGFPTAFNVKVTEKVNGKIELVFNTERNINVYSDFYKFLHESAGVFINGADDGARDGCKNMFQSGQVVFITELLNYASTLRTMERDYKVVPLPMYDELQKDYATNSEAVHSQLSMLKASPRNAAAGAVMEMLCYLTYKNVTLDYYDTLKFRNMREPQSVAMMELIMNSITSNFGAQFASELATPFPSPIGEKEDISSMLGSQDERMLFLLNEFKKKINKLT